jgi:hypothetical protein
MLALGMAAVAAFMMLKNFRHFVNFPIPLRRRH